MKYCARCGKSIRGGWSYWMSKYFHHKCVAEEVKERHPEWTEAETPA